MPQYYNLPEQYGGMNLYDIQNKTGQPFRADVLAGFLGVDPRQALTSGQSFSYSRNDPRSAEQQALQKLFTPGIAPEVKAAQDFAAQQQQTLQGAKTEAVGTLESGKAPLKQRYDDIIASIKGTADVRREEIGAATAESFGKRGIPLTSGIYGQELQKGYRPVDVAQASSLAGVGLQEQQGMNEINSAIASIQSTTGLNQVQAAIQLYQIGQQAQQFGLTFEEGIRQFNESLKQERELSQPQQQQDPFAQYKVLGEGQSIFDLSTLQNLFKNPKTYKGTSGGGGFNEGDYD